MAITSTTIEPFITKAALADALGMTPRYVELRMHDGLPVHRWGRTVRFRFSEVLTWLEER